MYSTYTGFEGCEDQYLDRESGLLYLACLAPSIRQNWEPAMNLLDASAMPTVSPGYFAMYDTRTGQRQRLDLAGLDAGFNPHGFDLFVEQVGDERRATIFAISHRMPSAGAEEGADSVIEVFETTIGTSTFDHVRTLRDPFIVTPNSVVALSPSTFYVTNGASSALCAKRTLIAVQTTSARRASYVTRLIASKRSV
jgi:hypothetical protein